LADIQAANVFGLGYLLTKCLIIECVRTRAGGAIRQEEGFRFLPLKKYIE